MDLNFDIMQVKITLRYRECSKRNEFEDIGVKSDEIRRNIDITPIIPDDAVERAENMIGRGAVYLSSE